MPKRSFSKNNILFLFMPLLTAIFLTVPSMAAEEKPFLGLQIQGIDQRFNDALGVSNLNGVMVRDVALAGPASLSGILRGDIITQVNDTKVSSVEQLAQLSATFKPNETVTFTLLRQTLEKTVTLSVGSRPQSWSVEKNEFAQFYQYGLTIASIKQKVRDRFNLGWAQRGVVVSLLNKEKSTELGLKVGDVIVQMNQQDVWKPSQMSSILEKAKADQKEMILMLIHGTDGFRYSFLPVLK